MSSVSRQDGPLEGRISAAQLDILVRGVWAIPTFPCVAARLVDLAIAAGRAENPSLRAAAMNEAICTIALDPPMAARILSLAGATGANVTSIPGAAEAIGFDALCSAMLSTETFNETGGSAGGLDRRGFWKHSLAVAISSEMLAGSLGGKISAEEAYVCGLLHNLGKLALDHCMPKSYARVLEAVRLGRTDSIECERRIIGFEQSVIGCRLAEHWRLPRVVREVIWLVRSPMAAIPRSVSSPTAIALVNLADTVVREQQLGFSENRGFPRDSAQLASDMGISKAALEDVVARLGEAVEDRFAALDLADSGRESIDPARAAKANTELGRLNTELLARDETLTAKADALGHVDSFVSDLAAEATTADVLEKIAAVMAAAIAAAPTPDAPVVAYSIDSEDRTGLAVCNTGDGQLLWETFTARGDMVGAAGSTGEVMSMIAADSVSLSQWVNRSLHVHRRLVCSHKWIGGVFYVASGGSSAAVESATESIAAVMGLSLSIIQGKARQKLLAEQLAGATQALSAATQTLAEAEAISAIGEMAAGAAHELNTPLAVISGRAQLMRDRAATDADKKVWQLIAEQSQSISDIISQLMAFARPPAAKVGDFDAVELLAEVAKSFTSSDHPQAAPAKVDIEIGESPLRVRADRSQIHAAIVELMINAANAAGDKLTVRLTAESDETNAKVLLTVQDAGAGMDERTLGRAFTPFFSVQKAGRRRGLGLPYVKRVVENNGGRIWIDSRVNEGTTVTVQLPMA